MKTARNLIAIAMLGVAAVTAGPAFAQPIAIELEVGFVPDPKIVQVQAGGTVELDEARGRDCTGYVTREPTVRLRYAAGREGLYIGVRSEADADTVLMVRTPGGEVTCNDDLSDETLNPGISLETPAPGVYQIWVGTFDEEAASPAQLRISEIGFQPEGD